MLPKNVARDFDSLPSEVQQQVINFIAFMKSQNQMTDQETIESSFGPLKADRSVTCWRVSIFTLRAGHQKNRHGSFAETISRLHKTQYAEALV